MIKKIKYSWTQVSESKKRCILYGLIFFSGLSALIYETVWQRYLVILLGAQAKANAITIGMFLGGLGLGYIYFGLLTQRTSRSLFRIYALIELVLGAWALIFPILFHLLSDFSPKLYQFFGSHSFIVDLFLSNLLILFPSFLMGGTLPVLTQAVIESLNREGLDETRIHARIYGFNTLGAALGCLMSGFILLPFIPFKVILLAGASLNFLIALETYLCFSLPRPTTSHSRVKTLKVFTREQYCVLAIAFISGFTVTALENLILRLYGLSAGSSHYSFSLTLSIFVLCLAVLPLLYRNFTRLSFKTLACLEILLAISLCLLYFSADYWSYGAHLIRILLRDLPEGFYLYQGLLGGALLICLFIPVSLAGAVMPWCFKLFQDSKATAGLQVGYLYFSNTIGAVLGAIVGGYLLSHFFNIEVIFLFCISLVVVAALFCSLFFTKSERGVFQFSIIGFGALILCSLFFFPQLHKERFLQAFRHSVPMDVSFEGANAFGEYLARSMRILDWQDGPSGSIAIGGSPKDGPDTSRTLYVNGKSDGNTAGDAFTMEMLGHLGALFAYEPERVCVIGLGTGVTAGVLAQYQDVKSLEIVELSEIVLKKARLFDAYNGSLTTHPKVRFHQMDAFRFLKSSARRFDLIVSEPSNPWVTGVENLYSTEFYEIAKKHLTHNGVFVQWIHSYSFNDDLMRRVLATLNQSFSHTSIFQLKGGDLAILAGNYIFNPAQFATITKRMSMSPIKEGLSRHQIGRIETLLGLQIIAPGWGRDLLKNTPVFELENPMLSERASKAFFANEVSRPFLDRRNSKDYIRNIEQSYLSQYLGTENLSVAALSDMGNAYCYGIQIQNSNLCEEVEIMLFLGSDKKLNGKADSAKREIAATQLSPRSTHVEMSQNEINQIYESFEVYKKYASPVVRVNPDYFLGRLDQCLRKTSKKNSLYGQCLLQKLLILNTLVGPEREFLELGSEYMSWFRTLPESSMDYLKLLNARDILAKMMVEAQ